MKTIPVHVGLDYHQGSIQACVLDQDGRLLLNRRCPNDVAEVMRTLESCGEVRTVAIESCAGAAEFADGLNAETGWDVSLAHPGYVNRMKLNPDKTDYADARLLADLGRIGYLPKVWLAPSAIRQLRTLVRRRQTAMNGRKATKLRVLSLLRTRRIKAPEGVGKAWTKRWIAWLRTAELSENDRWVVDAELRDFEHFTVEIQAAEARLRQVTRDDPIVAQLLMLSGIGPVTAWMLRAEIGNVNRFRTGKQMARFCGTSPRNCSSGERVADSGLIKAGNPQLKMVIIQAAQRFIRFDRRWMAFASRLYRAGKPTNVIVAAVANRWVRWLYHRMKEFEPAIH